MANCQEKEVDPLDAGYAAAGNLVTIYLPEPV